MRKKMFLIGQFWRYDSEFLHRDIFFPFWKSQPLRNIIFEKSKKIDTSLKSTNSKKKFTVTSRSHNFFRIWDFLSFSTENESFETKKKYDCKISKLIWALWKPWERICQKWAANQGSQGWKFQNSYFPREFAQTWSRPLFYH